MATTSEYSIGLSHNVMKALARAGFTPQQLHLLSAHGDQLFADLKAMVESRAECGAAKMIVDLDAQPEIRGAIEMPVHQKGGQFEWNVESLHVRPIRFPPQCSRHGYVAEECFNACLLDFLMAHPKLIPLSWREYNTVFFGSCFRHGSEYCYRGIEWQKDGWIVVNVYGNPTFGNTAFVCKRPA